MSTLDTASEIRFKQISPNKILTNPEGNPRKNIRQRDIEKLCESIVACNGIIVPLVVFEGPTEGTYYLLDGERRLIAAKKVGLQKVPINIIPKKLASDVNLATMFTIHMARVPWNTMARAMALNQYLSLRPDMESNKRELKRITGMSLAEINNAILIRIFPQSIQLRAVFPEKPGGMEPSYLIELAKLVVGAEKKGLSHESERKEVIDSFINKFGSIITDPYQLKDLQTLLNNIPLDESKNIFETLVKDPSCAIRPILESKVSTAKARFKSLHMKAESKACTTESSIDSITKQWTALISAIQTLNHENLSDEQLQQLTALLKQTTEAIEKLS